MVKYKHDELTHNLKAAERIVPFMMDLINPKSVVDVGCGIGTFLYQFKQAGVKEILGIDGPWANLDLLRKYLEPQEFQTTNLDQTLTINRRFDLVLSLEVVEHLNLSSADTIVQSLVKLGTVILFSAAIPYQGGQNHLNEQWLKYWQEKFSKHNYILHDIIRPLIWEDHEIEWWYKQNLVIFIHKDFKIDLLNQKQNIITNLIHPQLYLSKSRVVKGEASPGFYLNLLIKSILLKLGLYKKKYQGNFGDYGT